MGESEAAGIGAKVPDTKIICVVDCLFCARTHNKCDEVAAMHAGTEKSMQKSEEAPHVPGSQKRS